MMSNIPRIDEIKMTDESDGLIDLNTNSYLESLLKKKKIIKKKFHLNECNEYQLVKRKKSPVNKVEVE